MIPPTIEIVPYTSIICMILVYDTLHYDQPKSIRRTASVGCLGGITQQLIFLSHHGGCQLDCFKVNENRAILVDKHGYMGVN
jgi:hypothetical protein